ASRSWCAPIPPTRRRRVPSSGTRPSGRTERPMPRAMLRKVLLGVALIAFGSICGPHGPRAETLKARYVQAYSAARSIISLTVATAEREGFFAREGLSVEVLQPIPGGADRQITALLRDSVDLTHVATPFLIRAALAGSDAVAVAAEFR